MSDRQALRDRRPCLQFGFRRGPIGFTGCLGFSNDRKPLEVFLSCDKTTTEMESLGRDAAILISLALQFGCDFDTMRGAITRDEKGRASTLVGQLLDEIEKIDADDVDVIFGGAA